MARPKKAAPDYRYHVSGQAVVTFNGKNFYLGPHNSPESFAKYHRLVSQYVASGFRTPSDETHQAETPITVADVTAEARVWIKATFAASKAQTTRLNNLCSLLDDEYGDTPADEFGPRKLFELRELFVASGNCRKYANTQTRNVVRIFNYALSRELISADVIVKLKSLEPLRYGQTKAPESEPVRPVELEHVRETSKHLSPTLKAMIRVQAATGMRPGELCAMRPCDIDRTPDGVWIYRPAKHKTAHRGKTKAVPIVGDAKLALKPSLDRDPESFCFTPVESMEWYRQERAANRKTAANAGNGRGRKAGGLKGTEGKRFAVIADEAHSSQTGEAASKLKMVLSADEQRELDDGGTVSTEDILAAQMAARAGETGITYVAFTATPKAKTLELFGRRPDPSRPASVDNTPEPFHVYSMRQAIEEGFANSPDLTSEILSAVMETMDIQAELSTRALNSSDIREGLKRIMLKHLNLYENLRNRAKGA